MENQNLQTTDLKSTELVEINGCIFWEALVIALIVEVISDWDNFKAGLAGKPELK